MIIMQTICGRTTKKRCYWQKWLLLWIASVIFRCLVVVNTAVVAAAVETSFMVNSHYLTDIDDFIIKDTTITDDSTIHIPLFWHVPKSGGATIKNLFRECFHLVTAIQIGYSGTTLRIVSNQPQQVINIDTTTQDGWDHVQQLNFRGVVAGNTTTTTTQETLHRNLLRPNNNGTQTIDVVVSTRLESILINMFQNNHNPRYHHKKGLLFTIIRHPIHRAASLFYFKRDAQLDRRLQNMTLLDYLQFHYHDDSIIPKNWMMKMLLRVSQNSLRVVPPDNMRQALQEAKYLLRHFCMIGIFEQMETSIRRFGQFFHWDKHKTTTRQHEQSYETCLQKYIQNGVNIRSHPIVREGSPEWQAASQELQYDIELYHYALELFHNQSLVQ